MSNMNRKKIVRVVADKYDLTMTNVDVVICAVLEVVSDSLKAGEQVMFHGFGTFKTQTMAARKGRNPQTGESVNIPRKTIVKFRPSRNLKEMVNTK